MIYIIFLFFTFVVLAFVFYHSQYYFVFKPSYYRDVALDDEFELLSVVSDDGVELEGVVYEPKELYRHLATIESTLLFFPGNYHDVVGLIKKLSSLYPHVRIVAFNYRSYGKSGGTISEKNMLKDGVKIASLVQKNYGDFYILGYSLGSSVAAYVASKLKTKGVFLVGSFDSYYELVKKRYKTIDKISKINLSKMFRYKLNNKDHVKSIDAKTYLFGSKSDQIIHIHNTRNLKKHVKNLAYYDELENLTHIELLWDKKVVDTIKEVMK